MKVQHNIEELFALLNNIESQYYFRGYRDYTYHMRPSLARKSRLQTNEIHLIKEFSAIINNNKITTNNFIELLTYGQHYSLPTRLLDWSTNPFVSLFFALGEEQYFNNEPMYIGIISKRDQRITDDIPTIFLTLDDLNVTKIEDINELTLAQICSNDFCTPQDKNNYILSPIFDKTFLKQLDNMEKQIWFKYDKCIDNLRQEVQSGLFTMQKDINEPFSRELYKEIVLEFTKEEKIKILKNLSDLGINNFFLFPDPYKIEEKIKKLVNSISQF